MSKVISKIGRTFDKVFEKTGVKKIYEKVVPSGIRNAISKTWKKIRKPVLTAAAIYLTAGMATAAVGGTSLAGGFATVNSSIAGVFTGGAGAGATNTVAAGTTGSAGATSGGLLANTAGVATGATTTAGSAGTGLITSTGSIAGTAGATGTVSAATTAATGGTVAGASALPAATQSSGGFLGALKSGGKMAVNGAGKAWGAVTKNAGTALLTSSVLQGYGAHSQQKRQERLAEEERDRRSWYGMDGQGGNENLGIAPIQAPRLSESSTLDDLIKRRRGG